MRNWCKYWLIYILFAFVGGAVLWSVFVYLMGLLSPSMVVKSIFSIGPLAFSVFYAIVTCFITRTFSDGIDEDREKAKGFALTYPKVLFTLHIAYSFISSTIAALSAKSMGAFANPEHFVYCALGGASMFFIGSYPVLLRITSLIWRDIGEKYGYLGKSVGVGSKILFAIAGMTVIAAGVIYIITTVGSEKVTYRIMLHNKKNIVRSVVDTAMGIIEGNYELAKSGIISEEQAKELALKAIRDIRYGKNGYVWVNDLNGVMLAHPKKSLEGKNLMGLQDKRGKYIFRAFIDVARDKGEGFVEYWWPLPGGTVPQPKLSYVKLFKPWGWIVGTGLYINELAKEAEAMTADLTKVLGRKFVVLLLLLITIILIAGWFIADDVKSPLSRTNEVLVRTSQGDLTAVPPVETMDEIGETVSYIDLMITNTRKLIAEIMEATSQVVSATAQVGASSEEISEISQSVKDNINRIAGAMEELSASIRELVNHIRDAVTFAEKSENIARKSIETFGEIARWNKEIAAAQLKSIAKEAQRVSEEIKKIRDIVDVITNIADRTNLLALNAAIEAARAGEHGRGFAVVADEVRKLAEQTMKSTQNIEEMVSSISSIVGNFVRMIEDYASTAEKYTEKIVQSVSMLEDVATGADEVKMAMNQVEAMAEEQQVALEDATNGIVEIDQAMEELNVGINEIVKALADINEMMESLKKQMDKFKV
ncbi:MAG: methyl-accepting chemotaxis protein [Deferribacteres bacterium]|nr:methyl-accepting chemotaxis protein [Deferribacteres bacterium]